MKVFIILGLLSLQGFGKTITHEEWVEHFLKKDMNTRLQLDQLKSSSIAVKSKLGRIIPSLNLGTIIDTAISGPLGLVGNLSNLVGFLLPSRWFQWNESKMYYLSQYYAYMAVRGNYILSAEEIFLTLKKAYQASELLDEQLRLISPIIKSIELRERMGELPLGTLARVKTKYFNLKNDLGQYGLMIEQLLVEMNKLILAPDLSEIDSIEFRIKRRTGANYNWDYEIAREKSVEVKSLNALVKASHYSKKGRSWSFLSFSEDGFGLGYFARNARSTLEIEYLEKKRQEMNFGLKANLKNLSLEERSLQIQSKDLAVSDEFLGERIRQILDNYKFTGELDADDFVETLNNSLKNSFLIVSNRIQREYLEAQKDRFLLEGFYQKLNDNIPKRDIRKLQRFQKREDKIIKEEI